MWLILLNYQLWNNIILYFPLYTFKDKNKFIQILVLCIIKVSKNIVKCKRILITFHNIRAESYTKSHCVNFSWKKRKFVKDIFIGRYPETKLWKEQHCRLFIIVKYLCTLCVNSIPLGPYAGPYIGSGIHMNVHTSQYVTSFERHIDVRQTFCCAISYWLVSKRSQWSRVSFRKQLSTPLTEKLALCCVVDYRSKQGLPIGSKSDTTNVVYAMSILM